VARFWVPKIVRFWALAILGLVIPASDTRPLVSQCVRFEVLRHLASIFFYELLFLPYMATLDKVRFMRREYDVCLLINEQLILKVIIDPHYEEKHKDSVSDEIILELVKTLNHDEFRFEAERFPFSYYVKDKIVLKEKLYKLVWVFEEHQTYIGIINAYRR
jgi:hypothetical protein